MPKTIKQIEDAVEGFRQRVYCAPEKQLLEDAKKAKKADEEAAADAGLEPPGKDVREYLPLPELPEIPEAFYPPKPAFAHPETKVHVEMGTEIKRAPKSKPKKKKEGGEPETETEPESDDGIPVGTEREVPRVKVRPDGKPQRIVEVRGKILIDVEKFPELATAVQMLAKLHGWMPLCPPRPGHIEFLLEWRIIESLALELFRGYFNAARKDPANGIFTYEWLAEPGTTCAHFELGPEATLCFHFFHIFITQREKTELELVVKEIFQIESRHTRAEICLHILRHIVELDKLADLRKLTAFLNFVWITLTNWGWNPKEIGKDADSYKTRLFFNSREEFRRMYEAAGSSDLRFWPIDVVEDDIATSRGPPAQWLREDFLDPDNAATKVYRDDYDTFRKTPLTARECGPSLVTFPDPRFYEERPDLRKPWRQDPQKTVDTMGDPDCEREPWKGRINGIPSLKEVQASLDFYRRCREAGYM